MRSRRMMAGKQGAETPGADYGETQTISICADRFRGGYCHDRGGLSAARGPVGTGLDLPAARLDDYGYRDHRN